MGERRVKRRQRGTALAVAAAAIAVLAIVVAGPAGAHIERASYWPDPAPEAVGGQKGPTQSDIAMLKKKIKKARAQHHRKQVKKLKRRLHKLQAQAKADASAQPAGGAVPVVRPLATALDKALPGSTRVVCPGGAASVPKGPSKKALAKLRAKIKKAKAADKPKLVKKLRRKLANRRQAALYRHPSIRALQASIKQAEAHGYKFRPSQGPIAFSATAGKHLLNTNLRLLRACSFGSIQDAVTASGNNDRVVVMPGIYTEPKSRAAPTDDPKCDQYEEVNDRPGSSTPIGPGGFQTGANTYTYVANCPNDQNLIAVIGRQPNNGAIPPTPLQDRHGIPDQGACIRCNLQLEGSGVSADDVIVDGGRVASGNGTPVEPAKDVGIRADRADGFVLSNLTVRHVREHGLYVHEVDGYVLQRFKVFYAQEYGTLQFTSDHGLVQDCEAYGAGDAGLYPGSAPETGEQVVPPDTKRFNTEIRRCDSHHNAIGYSGTASNAVWIHDTDFYDNSLGWSTDVLTASGHPGFPQDSDLLEHNQIYSNNFNPFAPQPANNEVVPTLPAPVGVGFWILGGNNDEIRHNRIWDNWRRGGMLLTVPDAVICGDNPIAGGNHQSGCNETGSISTSYRNRFHDNVMGISPAGQILPNGDGNLAAGRVDFWWDQFPGSNTNCWYGNTGKAGTAASVTSVPPAPLLPSSCDPLLSTGTGPAFGQDAEVLSCLAGYAAGTTVPSCTYTQTPPKP
ncbi:MAG: hypothetical protein ABR536_03540 [Solirubrobacterales bacterium]